MLTLPALHGRFSGRIRVDVGPRGVGETSLLRRVHEDATRLGLAPLYVTAETSPVAASLQATRALRELIEKTSKEALSQGLTGIAVLVDELQDADEEGLRTVDYAWQELQAAQRRRSSSPQGSTTLPTSSRQRSPAPSASSFWAISSPAVLGSSTEGGLHRDSHRPRFFT